MYTIHVRATSIAIIPGKEAMEHLSIIINNHTIEDEYTETVYTVGVLYDDINDVLYLHKGIDVTYLQKLLGEVKIIFDKPSPYKTMKYNFEEIIPPRDEDQEDVIDFIAGINNHKDSSSNSQIFLVKVGGFGKLEPYSRKIPTPTPQGYTLMGDLKVGDYVFDRTGKPTKILQIFEHGIQDIYRIKFHDGREAYCGKDHLWSVHSSNHKEWITLRTRDLLIEGTNILSDEWYIPLCEPVQYDFHYGPDQLIQRLYSYGYSVKKIQHLTQDYRIDAIRPFMGLKIDSIGYSHREESRCIVVDNPEHLYLTEDFIVTHNTYCAGYSAGLYGVRTMIIMHRDSLRTQWMNSLFNMNGYPHNRVYELTSTEELYNIAIGKIQLDYDIYLMTHATFRATLKRIQDIKLMQNIPISLGIGLKIIDEAHLEFRDTIIIDSVFNVKRNLYLTATDGRSSRDENTIFKHVFSKAKYYEKKAIVKKKDETPSKWVEYIAIKINTHVKPNIYRYRVNGGKGMSPATYGKWVIQHDKKQTHFKVCVECLREIYEKEPQAKVLVFMPLIDLCTECAYYINKALNYDESFSYDLSVRTVNSHNSKMENERNKSADVIVTTIASLGTGSDIKGITDIICCSPFVSKITAQQVFWRIRYIPKPCHYYDIIDSSVQADIYWWKSRSKTFKRMCTNYKQLAWYEEENKNEQS